jgi:hypothetical protein
MLNLNINIRHKLPAYTACETEAINAYRHIAQIVHFIFSYVARYADSSLVVVSGKMTELSDILAEIGLKSNKSCLEYQIVGSGDRFLLTKWAIFYSIEVLETNTYNSLLFAGLLNRNRGLNRFISVLLVLGSNFEYWRSGPAELILCLLTAQPVYCRTPKISFLEKFQC